MQIKNFEARYHRNGICGEGFYACQFEHGGETLRAILFPKRDDNDDESKTPVQYAIIGADLSDRWRGDHFVDDLWKLIRTYPQNLLHDMAPVYAAKP